MKPTFFRNSMFLLTLGFSSITPSKAQLKVVNSGDVSIGGAYIPYGKLQVYGNALFTSTNVNLATTSLYATMVRGGNGSVSTATTPDFTWYNDNQTGIFHPAAWQIGIATAGTERIHIDWNGYVGIGTNSPSYQLHLSTNSAGKPSSSTWVIASDKRLKTNVKSYTKGLDIIRKLELVTYEYNGQGGTPNGEKGIGVIAQDFQKLLPDAVKPFTFVNKENGVKEEYLGVDFHELFMIYANAIKELDKQVTDQAKQIEALKSQLASCCSKDQASTSPSGLSSLNVASSGNGATRLLQNIPNPFTEKTEIGFTIASATKEITISIFDMQGTLLKTFDHLSVTDGKGSITISGNELKAGMYMYSLIIDGKEIDTKRMILTK